MSDSPRRRHDRTPIRRMGELTFRGIARKVSIIDLSSGGFSGMLLPEPLVPGTAVTALLPIGPEADPVPVRGVITWTQGRFFGVSFGQLEAASEAAIAAYLERHERAALNAAVRDLRAA